MLSALTREYQLGELMQTRLFFLSSLVLAIIGAGCANAQREGSIRVVDYGIYSPDRNNPELLIQTEEVPATVGTVFGLRVSMDGGLAADYDFRWAFPEMRNPTDDRVWVEMTGTKEVTGDGPHAFLVRINNAWEAKAGIWTIQLTQSGRVLVEKTFRVYAPPPKID